MSATSKNWKTSDAVYALDNDTLSLFLRRQEPTTSRILAVPSQAIWLPAITVEEQIRGRMTFLAGLNPARIADSLKVPLAYDLLLRTLRELEEFQFLPYDAAAEALYQSWPPAVKRLGTRDCRIAATAIVHGFTVITCNTRHFQSIPDVILEDWSV